MLKMKLEKIENDQLKEKVNGGKLLKTFKLVILVLNYTLMLLIKKKFCLIKV